MYLLNSRTCRGSRDVVFLCAADDLLPFAAHLKETKSPFQQAFGTYTHQLLLIAMCLCAFLLLLCLLGNGGKPIEEKGVLGCRGVIIYVSFSSKK